MENTSAAMLTTRSNYHHSKLPALGAIVNVRLYKHLDAQHTPRPYTIGGSPAWKSGWVRFRKFRVEAYPLCDGALYRGRHMSYGIHTVYLIALDNGQRVKVSGHYCETID